MLHYMIDLLPEVRALDLAINHEAESAHLVRTKRLDNGQTGTSRTHNV